MANIEIIEWVVPEQLPEIEPMPPDEPAPAPPAATENDNIQDIILTFPLPPELRTPDSKLEEVTLAFDMTAADLEIQLAKVAESAYALGGKEALLQLGKALQGTAESPALGAGFSRSLPTPGRGEAHYADPTESPNRHRLIQAYSKFRPRLLNKVKVCEQRIQECAVEFAIAHVTGARKEALAELPRYLRVDPRQLAVGALHQTSDSPFTGTDAVALCDAMGRIAEMRIALADALAAEATPTEAFAAQERDRRTQYRLALLGTTADQARAFAFAPGSAALPTPVAAALARTAATRTELAAHLDVMCSAHPVLYRLWQTDAVFKARTMFRNARATNIEQVKRAVATSTDLRAMVARALHNTIVAADAMIERFEGEPERVWRYPIAIDRATHYLGVAPGSVAWRAAMELVHTSEQSAVANAAEIAGYYALALTLVPGAQPLSVVADVVASVLAVGTLIENLRTASEQDDAWLCSLDPRQALAKGAGSYAASVLLLTTYLPTLRSNLAYGLGVTALAMAASHG